MSPLWLPILATFAAPLSKSEPTALALIPQPEHITAFAGEFWLTPRTPIVFGSGAQQEANMLAKTFRASTGILLPTRAQSQLLTGAIHFSLDSSRADLGDEGYTLNVSRVSVEAVAAKPAGLFYATQTLAQLLPIGADLASANKAGTWKLPCVEITDRPRFSWRGMHLDVSRHFYPAEFIKRYIDLLSMHKMNVFHWHLIDDGGWRMESKKYPQLTSRGAWRSSPQKGHWDYGNIKFPEHRKGDEYGGFYSQSQIRDIVRYAAERHVTIVPEIEMPGHTTPSIQVFPSLGCDPAPTADGSAPKPLNSNVYCAGKEETFKFVEDILDETMELFPSEYIHIGGDEVSKSFWNQCPRCKERMQKEGLKDANELQSYFIKRIEKYLNSKGRKLIGWDEILEGGLAPQATVMSWRGIEGGIEAVKQGKHAVMSPTSHCYFDYSYDSISTRRAYEYDPIPAELTPEQGKLILGAQGNVWTEWMPEEAIVEKMAYPRASALAEAVWSPKEGKDWDDFSKRLDLHLQRLDALQVHYYMWAPQPPFEAVLFDGSATLELPASTKSGLTLRFSTDGNDPTATSPIYERPIPVAQSQTLKAAYFRADGTHGDVARVQAVKVVNENMPELEPGWTVDVYQGKWDKIPDFSKLTPISTKTDPDVDLALKPSEDEFGLRFSGWITIPRTGVYVLGLTSDDGSRLKLQGFTVIDHDGLHAPTEKVIRALVPAGLYRIEIEYFERDGADRLAAWIQGPGLPRQSLNSSLVGHTRR